MIRKLIRRTVGCEHKSRRTTREISNISPRDGWQLDIWEKTECQDCGEWLDQDIRTVAIEGEEIEE